MIEEAQEAVAIATKRTTQPAQHAISRWQPRRLSAIEIAEGALLADIGVVFQLLIKYLPIGGDLLRLLVPVVFALLVLRRGLYVGCMSLCVSLFIVSIVLGPTGAPLLLLEAGAGLFLGLTMRHRLRHSSTVFLGVLCGAFALWVVILGVSFLTGGPASLVRGLRLAYNSLVPLLAFLFQIVGLGQIWHHTLFPLLNQFIQWGFQNWLFLFYLVLCALCAPIVIITYGITNFFLRLLGYQVRPFPGYRLESLGCWLVLKCLQPLPRRFLVKLPILYNLKREIRRLNIARWRQRRLAREARQTR